MENWLEHQLPQLSAEDLDMTEGLRMLSERLAFRRVLATSWWDRVHLEIPLACGTPIHWLLEHEAGRVTHAAVHLQAPEAPLRLRMSARNVARFYCVDGSSGLQLLARAAGLLGTLELIEGRQRPSPHTAFQALRRALLGA